MGSIENDECYTLRETIDNRDLRDIHSIKIIRDVMRDPQLYRKEGKMKRIYFNGDVVTVDDDKKSAEAVFIENGRILKVGKKDDVWALVDEHTEKVDLKGKTIMPGFVDPHSHFSMAGLAASIINIAPPPIGNVKSIKAMVEKLQDIVKVFKGSLLMAYGYDSNLLEEQRHPNKLDLDQVSTQIPIVVGHASLHVFSLNSVALKMLGYDENSTDVPGGFIERFPGTTEPTGYLEEKAFSEPYMKIVQSQPQSSEKLKAMVLKAQEWYVKNGVTTVQDGAGMDSEYGFYKGIEENSLLDIDIYSYPWILERNGFVDKKYPEKIGDWIGRCKLAGVKLVLDGSPQARTAYMSEPYCVVNEGDDPNYCSYLTYEDDQKVVDAIVECFENNYQFLTHCNGDGSLDQYLRCYKRALKVTQPKKELRPYVIHCQTAREEQLDEMKELGIYPSFFASHVYFWGDVHRKNFGEERAKKISNQKYALEIGLMFTDHEDTPVLPPNAIFSIWACVNRKTRSGFKLGEGIDVYEALKAHTINAAFCYFEEDNIGSITEGKKADFVITDKNILKVASDEIKDLKVLETIKSGKTVYKA